MNVRTRTNEPNSQTFSILSFVAGSIAGASGTILGHPLDSIKVHSQNGSPIPPFRFLFRGIALPLCSSGLVQSFALGLYENFRRALWPHDSLTPLSHIGVAGTLAGLPLAFITTPLTRIKVLQQLNGDSIWNTISAVTKGRTVNVALRQWEFALTRQKSTQPIKKFWKVL